MTDIKKLFRNATAATLSTATILTGTGTAQASLSNQYLGTQPTPQKEAHKQSATTAPSGDDAVVYRNFNGMGTNLIDITSNGIHGIVEFGPARGDAIGEGTIISDTLRARQDFLIDRKGKFVPLSDKNKPNRHADQLRALFTDSVKAMQKVETAMLSGTSFPEGLWGKPVKTPSGGEVIGATLAGSHYTMYTQKTGEITIAASGMRDPVTGELSQASMVFDPANPRTAIKVEQLAHGNPGDPQTNAAKLLVFANAASIMSYGGDNPYGPQPQENGIFTISANKAVARASGLREGTSIPILDARDMINPSYASFPSTDFHKALVKDYEAVARERAGYDYRPSSTPQGYQGSSRYLGMPEVK